MSENEQEPIAEGHTPSGIIQPEITPLANPSVIESSSESTYGQHQSSTGTSQPESDSFEEKFELRYAQAGYGKRLANSLLDTIFFYLFVLLVGAVYGVVVAVSNPDYDFDNTESELTFNLIGIGAFIFYYTFFEFATGGRTMGKLITRTMVVDEYGDKPGFLRCLGRTLGRIIPFDGIAIFFTEGRCLHDVVSKTYVIEADKAKK